MIQRISLPVSPYTVFYTWYYTEVKNYILYGRKELHFIYGKDAGKFMYVYMWPECAVCVRVMFNNHYNNFLAYTSQIWSVKKRHS